MTTCTSTHAKYLASSVRQNRYLLAVPDDAFCSTTTLYEWAHARTGVPMDLFLLAQNGHVLHCGKMTVRGQRIDMLPCCAQFCRGAMGLLRESAPVPWFQQWLEFSGTYMMGLDRRNKPFRTWAGIRLGLPPVVWDICFSYACDIDGVAAWKLAGQLNWIVLPVQEDDTLLI